MLEPDLQKGRAWVEQQISRLADNVEIPVAEVVWKQSTADEKQKVHTLDLTLGGERVEEKFTEENLIRILRDRKVRSRVEHRLKAVFRSCGLSIPEDEDDVIDATESEDKGVEFRYSITSYGADYPVDGLVRRLTDGDILIPPFQRRYVWNKTQSSRFVESLLLGLPVPAIFLGKEEDTNRLLVIDGQQRLRSLWHFYKGAFENNDEFVLSGVAQRFEGLSYRTLKESDRRRLNDAILHAIIIRQDQPAEDNSSSIYLLFERLNTGGALLHPQEIRACVYHGALNDLIAELNGHAAWRAVYGPENQRMKDRELILRFYALMFDLERYSRPMEEALNRYMASNRKLQRQSREQLIRVFVPTIEIINSALGTTAFRPVRAINAAVFDAVMVGLTRRLESLHNPDLEQIRVSYEALLEKTTFKAAYERSTSDEEQVKARIQIASEHFASTIQ